MQHLLYWMHIKSRAGAPPTCRSGQGGQTMRPHWGNQTDASPPCEGFFMGGFILIAKPRQMSNWLNGRTNMKRKYVRSAQQLSGHALVNHQTTCGAIVAVVWATAKDWYVCNGNLKWTFYWEREWTTHRSEDIVTRLRPHWLGLSSCALTAFVIMQSIHPLQKTFGTSLIHQKTISAWQPLIPKKRRCIMLDT